MDGIVLVGALGLTFSLYILKVAFHFEYLKEDKGKFKSFDSLPQMMLGIMVRPFYFLDHLGDMINLFYLPILWAAKTDRYRFRVTVVCYGLLALWLAVVGYFYLTGNYSRY